MFIKRALTLPIVCLLCQQMIRMVTKILMMTKAKATLLQEATQLNPMAVRKLFARCVVRVYGVVLRATLHYFCSTQTPA